MYQQARMEAEQPNIVDKLGDLPAINETYTQVLDIYERTKGRNVLFRTSLGFAEYATKAIVGKAVPCVYNRFTQPAIGRVNEYACSTLDALEEKYPIITSPREEILEEGKTRAEAIYMLPAMAPVRKYVKMGKAVADVGVGVGKAAVTVGTSVATTALAPAVFACRVGTNVVKTSTHVSFAAAEMSMDAMWHVLERMYSTGEETADYLSKTPCAQSCLEQFDLTLDATEKLVNQYLPEESKDPNGVVDEVSFERAERVSQLAGRVQKAMMDKAQGDLVRFRLMAGSLMQELLEITGFYLTLTADAGQAIWADRQYYADSFDSIWNKYAQQLPEKVRSEDPMKRATAVLKLVIDRLAELLALVLKHASSTLDISFDLFLKWCRRTQVFVRMYATTDVKTLINYFTRIFPYMANLVQWFIHSAISLLDASAQVLWIPADLRPLELEDVSMDNNCNGMGAEPQPQPVGNCVH